MKTAGLLLACCLLALSAWGQTYENDLFSYTSHIPRVALNDRAVTLQASLYPEMYQQRSAASDERWVQRNDSALAAFWEQRGDTVLHMLTELSGIDWVESQFDIYLVRYYPTIGSGEPLILPFGGITQGALIKAPPTEYEQILDLVYQLSRRMLAQADRPADSVFLPVAYHPLMKPGPYRFDNLAMLLALNTCQNLIGVDTTQEAWESAFWLDNFPGRYVLEQYMFNIWVLTPQQPLVNFVLNEPYGSSLVAAARPPRQPSSSQAAPDYHIEGLPLKGKLGFSVKIDNANFPQVDQIDVYRLAYACGLREGDEIRRVDGTLVRTQKNLVENILHGLDTQGGATLQVQRDGALESVVIVPLILPLMDNEEYLYDEDTLAPPDSLMQDQQPVDEDSTAVPPGPSPE